MELRMLFEKHIEFLKDTVDPDSAILDKLLAKNILSKRAIAEIKSQTTVHDKNETLLGHCNTRKKRESLLAKLTEDKQQHIVNYIQYDGGNYDGLDDCWPLTNREIGILDANQESLVDRIDAVDSGLIHKLRAKNVINSRQRDVIHAESVSFRRNDKLLEILRRRSVKDYKAAILCLKETKQDHIAVLLENGGVTAELDIKLRNVNNENAEKAVRNLFKRVLQPASEEDSGADLQNVSEDLRHQSIPYITDMRERLHLTDARIGESIILSFHCLEIDDLRKVKEELTTKHIENMFLTLYQALLKAEQVSVEVQWHRVSYSKCKQYLQDEDDDGLSTEDADEITPCEDDLLFTLSQKHLQRRISRIEIPKLCYYPSQEHVASLLIKRLKFIFSYYHKGTKLEDFKDFDFRIYTAGTKMLQEQTRRRLREREAECLPPDVYERIEALNYLSKKHVKTYRLTKETDTDLQELKVDVLKNPNKLFVIVADEAHFGVSNGGRGRELINTWNHKEHPNVIVILVTATPGIFLRDNASSRIPRISVAEKQKDGEFVVVQSKDELRKKKIIDVKTRKDISKKVGPVKELHLFNWNECYERRFEEGLIVTLRVPQRFSRNREEQIWLSVGDLVDNELYSVVGKTDENLATLLLLQGRSNIVRITNLDKSKTLVVIPSSGNAKKSDVGFVPTKSMSGKRLPYLCFFKVLMNSGEDVTEFEVFQENGPQRRLKYTYAKCKLELGPGSTDASKLDSSKTYQFLIDSYKNQKEKSRDQYLSLNFYYNSIRNLAPEEQLIRQDKNFEEMAVQLRYTCKPIDHLLAADYAYYIVLLECIRKTSLNENSFQNFIGNPMKFWKEYLSQRRSKLEALISALEDSKTAVPSTCFSRVVKFTENKSWEKLYGVCIILQKRKDLKQNNIDEFYEVLIEYLMNANSDSFTKNMETVKKAIKRHMQAVDRNAKTFKDVYNSKMISVLSKNESFRIVNDLIEEQEGGGGEEEEAHEELEQEEQKEQEQEDEQEELKEEVEENRKEQGNLNGHMKIIRAGSPETANSIYSTLALARKVANDTGDLFFEIIRYFQRFKLSNHQTSVPNSRIWQILQPKHCATYNKNSRKLCQCKNYAPEANELKCQKCFHPHHSVNTFFDLDRLPCIVIVVEMGRMGDTFPPSLNVMDLRARRPTKPSLHSLIQEVGRICRYQVKSDYPDLPYVLVASNVMKTLEGNLHNSVSFLRSAKLEADSESNWHHNRLLLVGEPQIGKTGVFLNIAAQLRKIIRGPNDKFDISKLPRSQSTSKRSAGESESHLPEKRRKVCKSQSLTNIKVGSHIWSSEGKFEEAEDSSKIRSSAKQHKFSDFVHCTICNKTFVEPRDLPCLHTFCLKCIQRVCDSKADSAFVACPMCEERFPLQDNGFQGFMENVFIKRLIDVTTMSDNSASRPLCDICNNRPSQSTFEIPEAILFCEECQEKICEGCKVFHERQDHELNPLENYHIYRRPTESCKLHKKPKDVYCIDCGSIFCAICFFEDHTDHKYSMIKTVISERRELLRKNAAEAANIAEETTTRIQKEINLRRSCIKYLQEQAVDLERRKGALGIHLSNAEQCKIYCNELADKGTVNDVLREAAAWQTKSEKVKQDHESMNHDIQIPTVDDAVKAATRSSLLVS